MDKLSYIRDRILRGDTEGKIFNEVAKDIEKAIEKDTIISLKAMHNVYIKQSILHLEDALKATMEFQEYMKNKEWRNNGAERISGQS